MAQSSCGGISASALCAATFITVNDVELYKKQRFFCV